MTRSRPTPIEIGLTAAIVAVEADEPRILVAADRQGEPRAGLPFGPFDPLAHRTFEIGLRAWVEAQTALNVGYVEQLYTFGDRGRHARPDDTGTHMVSVGYLALTRHVRQRRGAPRSRRGLEPWYRFFPGRTGATAGPASSTRPSCRRWAWASSRKSEPPRPLGRRERLRLCFGVDGSPWDEEKVLDRYELLYEAGLVEEARRDGREAACRARRLPPLGEADALRPSPHPRHRHRAAARQAQIPPGGVRADAGRNSR